MTAFVGFARRLWDTFRSIWLTRPALFALLEAWAFAAITLYLVAMVGDRVTPSFLRNAVFYTTYLAGVWMALRTRIFNEISWKKIVRQELLWGAALSVILIVGVWLPALLLDWEEPFRDNNFGLIGSIFILVSGGVVYCLVRPGISLWRFWNHLRRKSLVWSLTHAHMMVALIGAVFTLVFFSIVMLNSQRVSQTDLPSPIFSAASQLFTTLLPLLSVLGVMTVVALAVLMPPSALFSYIFARRTTRRLDGVVQTARRFRNGDYRARVPVEGEDEVAQLQSDFNAMAETLEHTLQELRNERERVEGLLQSRRELVANVSHELRTPVATLRSYLETSVEGWNGAPPDELRTDLEVMHGEILRLQALIDDLFTLSRAEVNHLTLRVGPVDIQQLIHQRGAAVAPLAWHSGRVEVVADVPASLPLAQADPGRLDQVLMNLLWNAIRHTPPGGIVAITAAEEPEKPFLCIEVRDTGEGIGPEDLPHIWERFYRGTTSEESYLSDERRSGAGLGLALVKELTEAMHGSVQVTSTPGQGSCFRILMPKSEQ